jgi:Ca2+-binding RTX toxin-like protein
MIDHARGGDDRLFGGAGADQLWGDSDNPFAPAGGNDQLIGGTGGDQLLGGAGDDQLWGDLDRASVDLSDRMRGADRFIFGNGCDQDTINDFENNKDLIDLRSFVGVDNISEVRAQARQVGADTVIDLGAAAGGAVGQDVLTLVAFSRAQLDAADFLFAA